MHYIPSLLKPNNEQTEILNKNVQLGTSPLQQICIKSNYYAQVYCITVIKYNRTLDLSHSPSPDTYLYTPLCNLGTVSCNWLFAQCKTHSMNNGS